MRPLLQQLEEMHIRIAETATHEDLLVKAIGDALTRLDDQLLQDVQSIATDHETRRTAILGELQGLASSIGMFQLPRPRYRGGADRVHAYRRRLARGGQQHPRRSRPTRQQIRRAARVISA